MGNKNNNNNFRRKTSHGSPLTPATRSPPTWAEKPPWSRWYPTWAPVKSPPHYRRLTKSSLHSRWSLNPSHSQWSHPQSYWRSHWLIPGHLQRLFKTSLPSPPSLATHSENNVTICGMALAVMRSNRSPNACPKHPQDIILKKHPNLRGQLQT